jgi:hypothetical protein
VKDMIDHARKNDKLIKQYKSALNL